MFVADRNTVPALVGLVFELSDPGSVRFAGVTPDSAKACNVAFGAALKTLMQGSRGGHYVDMYNTCTPPSASMVVVGCACGCR